MKMMRIKVRVIMTVMMWLPWVMSDDVVETIVGGKEGMGVRNKLGRSVGKAVVLLDA